MEGTEHVFFLAPCAVQGPPRGWGAVTDLSRGRHGWHWASLQPQWMPLGEGWWLGTMPTSPQRLSRGLKRRDRPINYRGQRPAVLPLALPFQLCLWHQDSDVPAGVGDTGSQKGRNPLRIPCVILVRQATNFGGSWINKNNTSQR